MICVLSFVFFSCLFQVVDKNCNNTSPQADNNFQNLNGCNQNNSNKTAVITTCSGGGVIRNINLNEQQQSGQMMIAHGQTENALVTQQHVNINPALLKTSAMAANFRAESNKQPHNPFQSKHQTQQHTVFTSKKSATSPLNQSNSVPLQHLSVSI